MKTFINPNHNSWSAIMQRPETNYTDLQDLVRTVFNDVQINGDEAVTNYTAKFDNVRLASMLVTEEELLNATNLVTAELKNAIKIAAENITKFHKAQLIKPAVIETTVGVTCWQENRPIEKVGIYIPGGTAPLFSTVLMLAIPAKIAGCKEIVLCTPPNQKGEINPAILYAASYVGINVILKVGGIQAIAGLSIGTASIPKVSKIFGPGNQYVTAAKQYCLQKGTAIDLPAGPSELLVMADNSADLEFVAADLLSQAEHGEDSQVVAVLASKELVNPLADYIKNQLAELPRKEIATAALKFARLVVLDKREDQLAFVNAYAPEHLIIAMQNSIDLLAEIQSAGSVFLGNYSPESAGDYASGTNHTLPTNGNAAMYSGVNLDAFVKKITVQNISKIGIQNLGPTIEILANAEELQAHKNAVTIRLKKLVK